MSRQFVQANIMADWQVAPADYEITTYDEPKFRYRKLVEQMIHPLSKKSVKKKTFLTISTNVLCAEISSKNQNLDPIDRDIYQPLEISISKWSTAHCYKERDQRPITTKVWIFNPGDPTDALGALDHENTHKIDYKSLKSNNTYTEKELDKVLAEINELLTSDRTVFSDTLRNCRQDLGCLKWLNRAVGHKIKPIQVYSAEDLYVVLLRHICPEDHPRDFICIGVARLRFDSTTNMYDNSLQCRYHQDRRRVDENEECGCCARLIAEAWGQVIMDDMRILLDLGNMPPGDHPGPNQPQASNPDPSADLIADLGALNLRGA